MAPATTSSSDGSGRRSAAAMAPRWRSKPTVAASTASGGDVDRGVEVVERGAEAGAGLRRDEHRAHAVARREEAGDGRDALGDEQLGPLAPAAGGGVGQLAVVGEAVDRRGRRSPPPRTGVCPPLTGSARSARASNTCPRTSVPSRCRCSASTTSRRSTTSFAGLRRIDLDGTLVARPRARLAVGRAAGVRPPRRRRSTGASGR